VRAPAPRLHLPADTRAGRKLTGTTALKLASPAPSVASVSRGRAASRASPVASRARRGTVAAELDEDAEGEDDVEEGEDGAGGEDDGIYCFCQRTSFGEMVACDNEQCPYQWVRPPADAAGAPALRHPHTVPPRVRGALERAARDVVLQGVRAQVCGAHAQAGPEVRAVLVGRVLHSCLCCIFYVSPLRMPLFVPRTRVWASESAVNCIIVSSSPNNSYTTMVDVAGSSVRRGS
jgi:hypothetical protein